MSQAALGSTATNITASPTSFTTRPSRAATASLASASNRPTSAPSARASSCWESRV